MKPSHLVSICCFFALTCNTNQSAMGRGNLKISITFMVARTALQAAGQGCKVTFALTEWQVSKNLLSNPSLYYREWAICHRRITTCPLSVRHKHTHKHTRVAALEMTWRGASNNHLGEMCSAEASVAFVSQILAPEKTKWESLFCFSGGVAEVSPS